MKWVLVVSMFLGHDAGPVSFATEAECMAAAAWIAEADPALERIDDPDIVEGHIRPVIRGTIECQGPEDRLEYQAPPPPRPEPA